VIETNLFPGVM